MTAWFRARAARREAARLAASRPLPKRLFTAAEVAWLISLRRELDELGALDGDDT